MARITNAAVLGGAAPGRTRVRARLFLAAAGRRATGSPLNRNGWRLRRPSDGELLAGLGGEQFGWLRCPADEVLRGGVAGERGEDESSRARSDDIRITRFE